MKKLLMTADAINAAIVAVKKTGQKWENDVQHIALSVIAHLDTHKNINIVTHLVDALPKGARGNAMKAYLEAFSKAQWIEPEGKDAGKFIYNRDKTTNMDGAAATTWASFTAETPYKPLDLNALLASIVKRANKDKRTSYDPAVIAGIEALIVPDAPKPVAAPCPSTLI